MSSISAFDSATDQPPAARLAAARSVIEGKFLDLGQVLESAVDLVGKQIAALDELTETFNAEAVDQATARLTDAATQLNGLHPERGGDRSRFQALSRDGRQLGAHIEVMQQALRYLHVFAVNIKVTAGGVPGAREVFQDFSEEVQAAIAAGRDELAEFTRELDKLAGDVTSAVALEAEVERRCASLLPAVPRQLSADAGALAEHHRRLAEVATETRDVVRKLQGRVGGALGGLQIGDTTRQRVEHVETALELIASARSQQRLTEEGAGVIHAMLAAQLEDTAAIFDRDVEKMAGHLAGVSEEARQVSRLRGAARGGGAQGSVLARLEASLGEAISLIADLETAEGAARDVGRSARSAAEELGQRIESIRAIKTNINHMALNAHLKCCQLGEAGRPLSVIAVELRVSSDQLGERAESSETILSGMGERASAPTEEETDAASKAGAVGALLQAAVEPIREADRKAGADLGDLGSETVATALRQATGRLDFRGAVSEVLVRVARELASEEVQTSAVASPGLVELMDEIGKHYTMAREREIHRAFLPQQQAAEAA